MVSLVILALAVAVLVALGLAFGGAVLGILLVIAGVGVVIWLVALVLSRRTLGEATEKSSRDSELLGPRGPDDPSAA